MKTKVDLTGDNQITTDVGLKHARYGKLFTLQPVRQNDYIL